MIDTILGYCIQIILQSPKKVTLLQWLIATQWSPRIAVSQYAWLLWLGNSNQLKTECSSRMSFLFGWYVSVTFMVYWCLLMCLSLLFIASHGKSIQNLWGLWIQSNMLIQRHVHIQDLKLSQHSEFILFFGDPQVASLVYILPLMDGFQFGLPLLATWHVSEW